VQTLLISTLFLSRFKIGSLQLQELSLSQIKERLKPKPKPDQITTATTGKKSSTRKADKSFAI